MHTSKVPSLMSFDNVSIPHKDIKYFYNPRKFHPACSQLIPCPGGNLFPDFSHHQTNS